MGPQSTRGGPRGRNWAGPHPTAGIWQPRNKLEKILRAGRGVVQTAGDWAEIYFAVNALGSSSYSPGVISGGGPQILRGFFGAPEGTFVVGG